MPHDGHLEGIKREFMDGLCGWLWKQHVLEEQVTRVAVGAPEGSIASGSSPAGSLDTRFLL